MAKNKVELYLIDMMMSFREVEKNMWLLDDEEYGLGAVAIVYDDPLVVFQVTVMEVPQERRLELFTKLLELNARDILHGAYALEKDTVILIDTLEYAGMDFTEFKAVLDAFGLALSQHYPVLSPYRT
ncbi:MAG: YbjN domain-containing protein [Spirochaetaceae bacterium]|jgi:hypothetical protein|nr:YbjN domain-containing protein [Spirochaetaceae bacterium]